MTHGTSIDKLKALVGQEIGLSDWVIVSQGMIDRFADATGDHQFIHVDVEKARQTPFGTTIAHGFLSLSLLPMLAAEVLPRPDGIKMGLNYGLNRLRFLSPVRSGKRVRARFIPKAFEEIRPGQLLSTYDVTVEIENEEKPALVAEWLGLTFV